MVLNMNIEHTLVLGFLHTSVTKAIIKATLPLVIMTMVVWLKDVIGTRRLGGVGKSILAYGKIFLSTQIW